MIGTIDIKVNAAHPNMPLCPIYAHIGSPSQVRIINVPKAIGKWAVTSVQITANYPDNTSRSVTATLVGGCWSATLPASTSVGQSLMGFKVTASGTDETGAAVTGYVLGKGDVFILNDDSTITIGSTTYYVHLLDVQPTYPKKGDLCLIGGAWKIYNGTEWIAFGGGTGDVRHAEFADMTADLDADESSLGDVMTKMNALITKLKGTTAALVALLALGSFAAVDVQTAKLSALPGKTMVVTNVTGAAAASDLTTATNALATAITNKADKSELALKQDKLPYATNAIPAGVISGAPWMTQNTADGRYLKMNGSVGSIGWEDGGQSLVLHAASFKGDVLGNVRGDSIIANDIYGYKYGVTGVSLVSYLDETYAKVGDIPTASSLHAVTYAADAPDAHKTAAGILTVAANAAGTKDEALFTSADYLTITNGTTTAATKSYVTSQNNTTRAIVETWENFLDGSNVVFSITNYISGSCNLDTAKLRIMEMTNGVYREVFNSRNEILLHLNNFKTNDFAVATNTVISGVIAAISDKADKDWGKYTSAGGEAPSNTVYMTAPSTVFAGGLDYKRVAVGEGMIGVLTTKGAPVYTTGDEGTFKFQDDGGTNYFGFAKTDSYTIGCDTDGINVNDHLVTLTYNVTMSGVPCIWYKSDISTTGGWEQLNTPDGNPVAGASHLVSWEATPAAGTEVCYINCPEAAGFFRATIEDEGSAKFMTNMPADLGGGILCTNTATEAIGTIRPVYNGSTVTWTWSGL